MFSLIQEDLARIFKNTSSAPLPVSRKLAFGIGNIISLAMKMRRLATYQHEVPEGDEHDREAVSKVDSWTSFFQSSSVGLENLGNTCYVNSVLQALFMTDRFTEIILNYGTSQSQQPVLHALKRLFILMKSWDNRVVSTANFLKLTNSQRGQQDSSEYLMTLFQILHKEDAKRLQGSPNMNFGEGSSGMSTEIMNDREYRSTCPPIELPESMTIIQSIFGGQLQIDIQCLQCGKLSSQTDFFTELPVFLPKEQTDMPCQPVNMDQLLNGLFSAEKLTDENKYECQECNSLQEGIRIQNVITPPQYLILILNRFKFNPLTKELQKLMNQVHCSEYLELPVASEPLSSIEYKLYAAVIHTGCNVESGHYYTLIQKADNQWWKMDDETVSKSKVQKLNQLNPTETPYILFYCTAPDHREVPSQDIYCSQPPSPDSSTKEDSFPPAEENHTPRKRLSLMDRKEITHKRASKKGSPRHKKSLNCVVQFLKDMHNR